MTADLIGGGGCGHIHKTRRGEGHVKMKAEVVCMLTKNCLQPSEARKARKDSSQEPGGVRPSRHLNFELLPPKL